MAFRSISTDATPGRPLVVTPPAGIVDGDILIAWCVFDNVIGSVVSITWPAGFTDVGSTPIGGTADGGVLAVATKKAASESGNYSIDGSTATYNLIGGVACFSGRDAVAFLNRSSIGSSNASNASPWDITTAAFATPTDAECDLVFIGWSDNQTGGTIAHAPPAGFTERADLSDGTFFNTALATQDAVASGATGALTGTGTGTGTAGWAGVALALKAAAGGGAPADVPADLSHSRQWQSVIAQ